MKMTGVAAVGSVTAATSIGYAATAKAGSDLELFRSPSGNSAANGTWFSPTYL
jgi:hypothetical protein